MAKELGLLPEFVQAVQNEFWSKNPEIYRHFCHFLGRRIEQAKQDELNEREYIREWSEKLSDVGTP